MSEWTECTLSEVANVIPGFAFKGEHFGERGVTVIKIKDITPPTISIDGAQKVDLANYSISKLEKYKLEKGDYVVAMTGATIGKVGRLLEGADVYINQRVAKIEPKSGVDRDFVYFSLIDSAFDAFVQNNIDSHSAQENISGTSIGRYPIILPQPDEQKAIAAVLSSLDDKIDLLHRQNKTLEAMTETLFRQWFVEEAQEDWEECTLDDVISVKGGTTPSTKVPEYWDGNICWSTPRDLSNHDSVFFFDTERKITEKGLAKIGSGLLPVGTVLLSSRAPIGYLAISDILVAINQGYIAIVCDKLASNYFMYLWCLANMDEIKSAGNGSTFEEISKSNFKALPLNIPSKRKLIEFDKVIAPTFEKIKTNQKQIRTLEKLRDTLLPKLMSGEVRVDFSPTEQREAA